MTFKEMNSYNKMDEELRLHNIHFWVKKQDGTIFDPYFKEYDDFKRTHILSGDNVYEEEQDTEFIEKCRKYYMKQTIIPTLKRYKKDKKSIKSLYDNYVTNPKPYHCLMTSFVYQQKHGGAIFSGKLGWKHEYTGEVKWMFGDN